MIFYQNLGKKEWYYLPFIFSFDCVKRWMSGWKKEANTEVPKTCIPAGAAKVGCKVGCKFGCAKNGWLPIWKGAEYVFWFALILSKNSSKAQGCGWSLVASCCGFGDRGAACVAHAALALQSWLTSGTTHTFRNRSEAEDAADREKTGDATMSLSIFLHSQRFCTCRSPSRQFLVNCN